MKSGGGAEGAERQSMAQYLTVERSEGESTPMVRCSRVEIYFNLSA